MLGKKRRGKKVFPASVEVGELGLMGNRGKKGGSMKNPRVEDSRGGHTEGGTKRG